MGLAQTGLQTNATGLPKYCGNTHTHGPTKISDGSNTSQYKRIHGPIQMSYRRTQSLMGVHNKVMAVVRKCAHKEVGPTHNWWFL